MDIKRLEIYHTPTEKSVIQSIVRALKASQAMSMAT